MVKIRCSHCGQEITIPEAPAGSRMVCPICRGDLSGSSSAGQGGGPSRATQPLPRDSVGDGGEGVSFPRMEPPEDVMDMTPMVDVVFQLLIFFMMTAAFSLQKSLEVPPPDPTDETAQSQTLEELENENDFVIVRIDREDVVTVEGQDAPGEQDLLIKLREARNGAGGAAASRSGMLVLADPACRHETVVRALDAGNAVGMERIRLATVEDTEF
ncbi:MAG: biopolymer transporter ExbD [Thermogutta sp.]